MASIPINACDSRKWLTAEELASTNVFSGHDLLEEIHFSSCSAFNLKITLQWISLLTPVMSCTSPHLGCPTAITQSQGWESPSVGFKSALGIISWAVTSLLKKWNRTRNSRGLSGISCNLCFREVYISIPHGNIKYVSTVDHRHKHLAS